MDRTNGMTSAVPPTGNQDWPVASYQHRRFNARTDTRQWLYVSTPMDEAGTLTSESWEQFGQVFRVKTQAEEFKPYFFPASKTGMALQVKALARGYRELVLRRSPLDAIQDYDYEMETLCFKPSGKRRECRPFEFRFFHRWANRQVEVATRVLRQIFSPVATNQTQEMLVELSAMSLAAAGFNAQRERVIDSPKQLLGVEGGFKGKKYWIQCLFQTKDLLARRVKRHVALLNEVKTRALPYLRTRIDKANLSPETYAEELVHRGKMLLICAPTERLFQQRDLVFNLGYAVDAVESDGLKNADERWRCTPEYLNLVSPPGYTSPSSRPQIPRLASIPSNKIADLEHHIQQAEVLLLPAL